MASMPGFTAEASLCTRKTRFASASEIRPSAYANSVFPAYDPCYEWCLQRCTGRGYDYNWCSVVCFNACTRNV
jgi:hypothetical protein